MNFLWRNLIIFIGGVITFLFLASGNSYSATKVDNDASSSSKNDDLLYATPSVLSHQNFFAVTTSSTCSSGSTPTFKPGQMVSSDVFNDIFSRIDNVTEGFKSSSELVGTWSCTVYVFPTGTSCSLTGFYSVDPSNMFATLTDIVTFKDNGNGSYSYASAKYPLNTCDKNNGGGGPAVAIPESGIYTVVRNYMLIRPAASINWIDFGVPSGGFLPIRKINKYSFVLESFNTRLITCDRQDIPPIDPTDLSASIYSYLFPESHSGLKPEKIILLTWKNSCNSTATSIKVLRKDSPTADFSVVATLPASAESYKDTVPDPGSYWYRIKASNSYGDSGGGNVVVIW